MKIQMLTRLSKLSEEFNVSFSNDNLQNTEDLTTMQQIAIVLTNQVQCKPAVASVNGM